MGMPILHVGAEVMCLHEGEAEPTLSNPRVKVNSMEIITVNCQYTITGCVLPPPPSGNGPCTSATWTGIGVATRVRAGGLPVVLLNSQATCVPSGTGLQVMSVQTQVIAE